MPVAALTTIAAVSTASSAVIDWPRKVGIAGRVDQVDAHLLVQQVHQRRIERVLDPAFHRVEVGDGRAAFEAARRADRAGLPEQASARLVLPDAGWPTRASVRMADVVSGAFEAKSVSLFDKPARTERRALGLG
jgi:hypothetical protein